MANEYIVVGLGKSNLAAVDYLLGKGIIPMVVDSRDTPPLKDKLPQNVVFKSGDFSLFTEEFCAARTLVVGPGVPLYTPAIKAAIDKGVEVIGDIELFVREVNEPVIGITGANGKSTVTTLVGLMAKNAGIRVGVGGNIGVPALELLKEPAKLYVLELSSFQLETTRSLHAAGCTILNVTEDHMDRYEFDIEKYAQAKHIIYNNACHVIYNRFDPRTFPRDESVARVSFGDDEREYGLIHEAGHTYLAKFGRLVMDAAEMKIAGKHNQMNALAAMALADVVGISEEAQIETLRTFTGLEHRCQFVAEINGVRYYNDSKATNVGSTLAAVDGLASVTRGDLYLLAGGIGKGQNFAPIGELLKGRIKEMYCFGRDAKDLLVLGDNAVSATDMEDALRKAYMNAKPGDVVLLAPACASMDMFKNFEERGDVFVSLVKKLESEKC